jgi:UDP-N-acetylmuramoyl-L-alanyl-D-glutamate--2,6-diaminopimelate ligase
VRLRTLVKGVLPRGLFRAIEPFGHHIEAMVVAARYGFPARGMRVIGVTGTNGKTTTSFMIQTMMNKAGYNPALMTTVAYGVGDTITPQVAHMTTLSAPALQKRLRDFRRRGVTWVVLETTSHALAQHRVWGVPFEIAVLTNITHEHLDYHGTFERYVAAKRRLFELAAKQPRGYGIANADDPSGPLFLSAIPHGVSYGLQAGQLRAENITLSADGSTYTAVIEHDRYDITCHIPGEFNVYNSLAAVAVGRRLGLTKLQIEEGIAALEGVEGRMDVIDEGQQFSVVIDFAHTPDSFERLLRDLRKSTKGKLLVMFGSAGRRDEAKRSIQGEIAGRYADEVILTEEDDRDIDGQVILEQIAEGAMTAGKQRDKDLFLLLDRSTAIHFVLSRATHHSDVVLLLGKGHEKTIERADGEHPWNEADEVRSALRLIVER